MLILSLLMLSIAPISAVGAFFLAILVRHQLNPKKPLKTFSNLIATKLEAKITIRPTFRSPRKTYNTKMQFVPLKTSTPKKRTAQEASVMQRTSPSKKTPVKKEMEGEGEEIGPIFLLTPIKLIHKRARHPKSKYLDHLCLKKQRMEEPQDVNGEPAKKCCLSPKKLEHVFQDVVDQDVWDNEIEVYYIIKNEDDDQKKN